MKNKKYLKIDAKSGFYKIYQKKLNPKRKSNLNNIYLESKVKEGLLDFIFRTYIADSNYQNYLHKNKGYWINKYEDFWNLTIDFNQKYLLKEDISKLENYLKDNNIKYKKIEIVESKTYGYPYAYLNISFDYLNIN